ncbi:hypothetical protein [Methanobrevibacter sp.]|uniref:hypothetical protein n=1 Tax=Methanobrevibacter sp. TaxID=66852 RepID=UPI00386E8DC4
MGFKDRITKVISSPEIDENDIESLINKGLKEITLKKDIDLTKTVNINTDNITIDGKNHAITSNREQIFNITGDNITLKNITFKNAHPDQAGGAIYNRNGKLRIIECNFINNHSARDNGGAIYNENGSVIIDSCDFRSNTARFGGAIYNKKTMTVMFSNFSNNNSSKGPSIFNASDLTLETCNFKMGRKAQDIEVYNVGIINIKSFQKDFINGITHGGFIHINSNDAKSPKYLNDLIQSGKSEIKLDCDIEFEGENEIVIDIDNLRIDGTGHRIDAMGMSNIFKITADNVSLSNINFRNGTSEEGGAIINKGKSLSLFNCDFDCNISSDGGALKNEGTLEAKKCNFNKNIANSDNGGAISNCGNLKLTDCNFLYNSAIGNGGAIDNKKILDLNNCCFKSNVAKNGGVLNNEGNVSLDECRFRENKAFKQGSVLFNASIVWMKNCKSINNISNKYSNIIFQNDNESSELIIEKCIFTRDSFNNNLIFLENGKSHIKSSQFIIKREHEDSFIIYNENAIVKVENLEFENLSNNLIYNNNILEIEKELKDYVKSGNESLNIKYL